MQQNQPLILPNNQTTNTRKQFFRDDQNVTKLAKRVCSVKFWQDALAVLVLVGVAGITVAFVGSFLTGRSSNRSTVTGVVSKGGAILNKPFNREVQSLGDIYNFEDTPVVTPQTPGNREVTIKN